MGQFLEVGIGVAAWLYVARCVCTILRHLPDLWANCRFDFHRHVLCKLSYHAHKAEHGIVLPCRYCYKEQAHEATE